MGNFLMGLGLGIVTGMLFAPKSGSETREYVGSMASGGVDYVKRQSQELKDSAMDMVDRGKEMVKGQVEKMASSAQDTGREVYQR
jgi:gas vesicle protein